MRPELGRTQYCLGAVVLTLNEMGSWVGLRMMRVSLMASVKGPMWIQMHGQCCVAVGSGAVEA